jgi:hypothetical protein
MAPPSPRVGPSPLAVVLALLTAVVVGFLAGALLATTAGRPAPPPVSTAPATAAAPTAVPTSDPGAVGVLTLTADRSQADTRELIRLEGTLQPARAGVVLQVQQSVDGSDFSDFPVTATTRGDGSYGVWVRTGREGRNQFRMVTTLDGQAVASPGVVVDVG